MSALTPLQRAFINRYQGGFPLCERPFHDIARVLDSSENRLIDALDDLLERGLLSRFGPLYDATRLGGELTLAAMSVPAGRFEAVAQQVNGFDEVAHNYRREHLLNMWFVIATARPGESRRTLERIENLTGLPVYNFPKQHEFHLGLWLHLDASGGVDTRPLPRSLPRPPNRLPPAARHDHADDIDRRIIHLTQSGLPVDTMPYRLVAKQAGISQNELILRLHKLLETGIIRRIGAVPNHYRLGLRANGMTVWDINDARARELGQQVAGLDFVSHCYLRPRRPPVWPYNLFAMVHGRSRDEVEQKTRRLARLLGPDAARHDTLYSSEILKKTGMRLAA